MKVDKERIVQAIWDATERAIMVSVTIQNANSPQRIGKKQMARTNWFNAESIINVDRP